jgi:hypothetical protein
LTSLTEEKTSTTQLLAKNNRVPTENTLPDKVESCTDENKKHAGQKSHPKFECTNKEEHAFLGGAFINCHLTPTKTFVPCSTQPCPKRETAAKDFQPPFEVPNQTNRKLTEDFYLAKGCQRLPHFFLINHARDFHKTKDKRQLYCYLSPCPNRYNEKGPIAKGVTEHPNSQNEPQARERNTPTYICKKEDCHLSRLTDRKDV